MSRQAPHIRDAGPGDAAQLLELWAEAARSGGNSLRAQDDAERALANLAAASDERLLVAESEGRIVAAMKVSRGPISPLVLESVVHTSFLLVLPEFRRHGYGRALMEAAVGWAEEKDISELTVMTDGNRETNRFFARLGLSSVATVRHSSVQVVRKKLSVEGRHRGAGSNRHLVEVLAQRRSARRRQSSD
jgi:GNAT superfamily N-acetyltransferase